MTYSDKVMQGIKFDSELLAPRETEKLRFCIATRLHAAFGCPGDVFAGAPSQSGGNCPERLCCMNCWDQEAE